MNDKILTITTSSGFEYHIDRDNLDDMEIFEDLMTMEDPDTPQVKRTFATNRVFQRMLGDEQKQALEAFLKLKEGRVRISTYQREILEIFQGMDEAKKK